MRRAAGARLARRADTMLRRAEEHAGKAKLRDLRAANQELGVRLVRLRSSIVVGPPQLKNGGIYEVYLWPPGHARAFHLSDVYGDQKLANAKAYELARAWLADSRDESRERSAVARLSLYPYEPRILHAARSELVGLLRARQDQAATLSPIELRAVDLVREINNGKIPGYVAGFSELVATLGLPEEDCRKLVADLIERGVLVDVENDS
jgi:hypothetical protein